MRFLNEHLPPFASPRRTIEKHIYGEGRLDSSVILRFRKWKGAVSLTIQDRLNDGRSPGDTFTLWGVEWSGIVRDLTELLNSRETASQSFDHPAKANYRTTLTLNQDEALAIAIRTPWSSLTTIRHPDLTILLRGHFSSI